MEERPLMTNVGFTLAAVDFRFWRVGIKAHWGDIGDRLWTWVYHINDWWMEFWVEELEKTCEITCRTWTTTIHFYRKLICVWFNDSRKFQQHGFVSRYLKWCTLWQEANHVARVIYNLILGVVTIVTADSFGTPSIPWWESSFQLGLPGLPVPQVTIQTVSSLRPVNTTPPPLLSSPAKLLFFNMLKLNTAELIYIIWRTHIYFLKLTYYIKIGIQKPSKIKPLLIKSSISKGANRNAQASLPAKSPNALWSFRKVHRNSWDSGGDDCYKTNPAPASQWTYIYIYMYIIGIYNYIYIEV